MRAPGSITVFAERARIGNILVFVLAIAGAVVGTAGLALAGEEAIVQISAILASRESHEFDPRLASLRPELRGLPFKGYTLLALQPCRLEAGDHCAMEIPGGGYLHVTTTESTARHLRMRLLLNQQNRPILNADIKLNRDAGILLKSARTEMGVIILSIKSSTPASTTAAQQVAQ